LTSGRKLIGIARGPEIVTLPLAPHLFRTRRPRLETTPRRLLGEASPSRIFAERPAITEPFVGRTSRPGHESASQVAT
jgi:hypothetical protein